MKEKWEYLTTFLEAKTSKDTKTYIKNNFDKKAKKHSPESMIPELNKLGEDGWELVSMEPVAQVGGKEDILISGEDRKWSHAFFCVFKRRKEDSALPVVAVTDPEEQARQQQQYAEYYRQQQAAAQRAQQAQASNPQQSGQ